MIDEFKAEARAAFSIRREGDPDFTPIEELVSFNFSDALNLIGNTVGGAPGQAALHAAYEAGVICHFRVQLEPNPGKNVGALYAFSALVVSLSDVPGTPQDIVRFAAKLKISGRISKTVGC